MAMNAPRYTVTEALRDNMGWSTFRETGETTISIQSRPTPIYKTTLEQLEDMGLAQTVYI